MSRDSSVITSGKLENFSEIVLPDSLVVQNSGGRDSGLSRSLAEPKRITSADIYTAFDKLASAVYVKPQNDKSCAVRPVEFGKSLIYLFFFAASSIGLGPGSIFAGDFAKTFQLQLLPGIDQAAFERLVKATYMVANLAINLISIQTLGDDLSRKIFSSKEYKAWKSQMRPFVTAEILTGLIGLLMSLASWFAISAQNRDPDHATQTVLDNIMRVSGCLSAAVQLFRAFESVANVDVKAALQSSILCGNGITVRARVHGFKTEIIKRLSALSPGTYPEEKMTRHASAIADGLNNAYAAIYRPVFFASSVWLVWPYIQSAYIEASDEELKDSSAILREVVAPTVAGFMTFLFSNVTMKLASRYTDAVVSKLIGLPTVHAPKLGVGRLAGDLACAANAGPSTAGAMGRFAQFSDNDLRTKAEVLDAVAGGLRGGAGLNLHDTIKVTESLPKLATSMLYGRKQKSKFLKKKVYGDSFDAFLKNVMVVASNDAFSMKLGAYVMHDEQQPLLAEQDLEANSHTAEVMTVSCTYPRTSVLGAFNSLFHKTVDEKIEIKDPAFFNAIALLKKLQGRGLDLNELYQQWVSHTGDSELEFVPVAGEKPDAAGVVRRVQSLFIRGTVLPEEQKGSVQRTSSLVI
jgi:hypothetical protein